MSANGNRRENPGARALSLAARTMRLTLLVLSRRAADAIAALRRKSAKLQIRLDGIDDAFAVKPVGDIPAPNVSLGSGNPVSAIMAAPEFASATAFFADNPAASRSLVSPQSQALLYCVLRNLKPDHVFEIGTFRAGTTEAICRALHANGRGKAHAVEPFDGGHVAAILGHWPPELFRHVELYAMDSMAFFEKKERAGVHPGLVFVDGNHDYEFALFDIGSAARVIAPGGFIFVDNIAQAGPFFAARDFLAANPGWRELGTTVRDHNRDKAFDPHRTTILNTDFMVLQAPMTREIDARPRNFGLVRWWRPRASGVRLRVLPPKQPGTLSVQVVLRGFGMRLAETLAEASVQVNPGAGSVDVPFASPAQLAGQFLYFTIEPWLIWRGEEPLQLVGDPEPY